MDMRFAALGDDLLRGHYLHQEKEVCPKDDSHSQSIMKFSNVIRYRKKELVDLSTELQGKLQSKPQSNDVSGQIQTCAVLLFRSGVSDRVCIYVVFLHTVKKHVLLEKLFRILNMHVEHLNIFISIYSRNPFFLTSAPSQGSHKIGHEKTVWYLC